MPMKAPEIEALASARQELKLTIREIAQRANMAEGVVLAVLSGRHDSRLSTIRKLREAIDAIRQERAAEPAA